MTGRQLDLFSWGGVLPPSPARRSGTPGRAVPSELGDAALVAAIMDASLADAPALAAEAGRRRLAAAVPALEGVCRRFAGFGLERAIPEQVAALEALAMIGGSEAAPAVARIMIKGVVQGPAAIARSGKRRRDRGRGTGAARNAGPSVTTFSTRYVGPVEAAPLDQRKPVVDRPAMIRSNYMRLALEAAAAAAERGEVPVGAVIVDGDAGAVLARAGNRVEELDDPTAHAEMLAIRAAARESGAPRLPACDLYVTLEPCTMCAAAISLARLRRLYFGAYDAKGGGVEHGARVFDLPTCHHRPTVYGGLEETAAQALLRRFFTERR